MSKKKSREQIAAGLKQEIEDWEDYLLFDLQERVKKNGGKALSERQLKKTTNGDVTYERMVRVIGRGNPDRLRQVMMRMVQGVQNVQVAKEAQGVQVTRAAKKLQPVQKVQDVKNEPLMGETPWEVSQSTEKPKRQKWTKASLLVFLKGKCRELGRVPTSTQIAEWSRKKMCPSYPTCMKLLEAKTKAEWEMILLGE